MNIKTFTASVIIALSFASTSEAKSSAVLSLDGQETIKEFREACRLYDKGMVNRSKVLFDAMSDKDSKADSEGYSVLCDVMMKTPGYELRMKEFFRTYPYSVHIPQIRYAYALNLFDAQKYKAASAELALIKPKQLEKSQRTEFLFKRAYSDLENKDYDISGAYVLCNDNVQKAGRITYLPMYMTMFIRNDRQEEQPLVCPPDLTGLV